MIRNIRLEDASDIKRICEEALGYETSADLIVRRICETVNDRHYFIRVYEDDADGTVKGYIQAEKYTVIYSGSGWNVISLAAAPDAQGRGIGKALMNALEEHAAADGSDFVRLNSRIEREGAHGFYEHLGYTGDKTQKRFIRYLPRS